MTCARPAAPCGWASRSPESTASGGEVRVRSTVRGGARLRPAGRLRRPLLRPAGADGGGGARALDRAVPRRVLQAHPGAAGDGQGPDLSGPGSRPTRSSACTSRAASMAASTSAPTPCSRSSARDTGARTSRRRTCLTCSSPSGFRRLARKHWRMGAAEMWGSVSKRAFIAPCPGLHPGADVCGRRAGWSRRPRPGARP